MRPLMFLVLMLMAGALLLACSLVYVPVHWLVGVLKRFSDWAEIELLLARTERLIRRRQP